MRFSTKTAVEVTVFWGVCCFVLEIEERKENYCNDDWLRMQLDKPFYWANFYYLLKFAVIQKLETSHGCDVQRDRVRTYSCSYKDNKRFYIGKYPDLHKFNSNPFWNTVEAKDNSEKRKCCNKFSKLHVECDDNEKRGRDRELWANGSDKGTLANV